MACQTTDRNSEVLYLGWKTYILYTYIYIYILYNTVSQVGHVDQRVMVEFL